MSKTVTEIVVGSLEACARHWTTSPWPREDGSAIIAVRVRLRPGDLIGPYEIVSLVGQGGMGEVYRASDTRLHRDVALKTLPAGIANSDVRRARFEREALAISQLNHPNICAIYDIGVHDGVSYFVMEYVDGESLAHRLRRGPLEWPVAVKWAIQIATALDAAHRRGITHRDVKPANAW